MISEVRVEGLKELRRAVRQIGDQDLKRALRAAHKAGAEKVVAAALPDVPVGATGNLKRSVRALGSQTSGQAKAGFPRATTNAKSGTVAYAAAIHWGTGPRAGLPGPHNIKARPFLHDAAQALRPDIAREYASRIDKILHAMRS